MWGESVDDLGDRFLMLLVCLEAIACGVRVWVLGDRFLIEIRGDRCFDVVGLLRGDRLCGESMDI